ncbi:MAG: winged helix-turn-helix transcriptional regulator [archaeon]|jgi:predicted transcriptional regulator
MAKEKREGRGFPDIYRPELIYSANEIKTFNKNQKKTTKPPSSKNKKTSIEEDYALPIMKASVKHVSTKRARFKVVVRKVERPFKDDFEHQLTWICSSLGFFEPIDKDKNAAAVFKEIVLATEKGEALTSTAIAERIGMSRGAVLNHLNNLIRPGLIEKNGRFYSARSRSMKRTIEEIEEDVERIFSQLKKAAEEIDKQIGFEEDEEN